MVTTLVKHEVVLQARGGHAVAVPSTLADVSVGHIAQFSTTEDAFRVVFDNWPFKEPKHEVKSSDDHLTFENVGPFKFYCYVTPKGATEELSYPAGSGGGNGNVKPPGK